MSGIKIQQFGGIAPRYTPRALNNNLAQKASNCRVDRGGIESLNTIGYDASPGGNKKSLYKYRDTWLYSSRRRHYVKSPLPNDSYDRLYYSETPEEGDSGIKPIVRSLSQEFDLGIPQALPCLYVPENSTLGDVSDPLLLEDRAYIVTYVDAWGQEGPPSDPIYVFDIGVHTDVLPVSIALVLPALPSGNYNMGDGARIKVYRTLSGSGATEFQFVGENVKVGGSFNQFLFDEIQNGYLGEVLESAEWIGPPNDDTSLYPNGPLINLISAGNGVMTGYTGNMIAFSEPYKAHAWPVRYRYSIEYEIRGLVSLPGGILILTEAKPYMAVGNDPSAIAIIPVDTAQACVSSDSIVDMGDYAMYASQDGLCIADGRDVRVISRPLVDEQGWRANYNPETIRAWLWEGIYVAFYGSYTLGTGFAFDPRGQNPAMIDLDGMKVTAGWYENDQDTLHLIWQDGAAWKHGGFDQGDSLLPMIWWSKEFYDVRREAHTWFRPLGNFTSLSYTIYTNDKVLTTGITTDNKPIRLPGGNMFEQWSIMFSVVNGLIEMVNITSNTDELA